MRIKEHIEEIEGKLTIKNYLGGNYYENYEKGASDDSEEIGKG